MYHIIFNMMHTRMGVLCEYVFVEKRVCPLHYRKRPTDVRVTLLSEMVKPPVLQRKIQYAYVGTRTRFSHY